MSNIRNNKINKSEIRKLELANRKKRNKTISIIVVILLVVVGLGAYLTLSNPAITTEDKKISQSSSLVYTDTEVLVPLAGISNEAEFYTYDFEGVGIDFFAVIGSDGNVRVAFDACDVCFHAKEGYQQDGDNMKCINCGLEFSILGLGAENIGGGCWPSFLPIKIDSDSVVIEKKDLEAKKFMFV
jgi:uncharacterized membrane protein